MEKQLRTKEAEKITKTRELAAKRLQKEVEESLSELDMPKVRFETEFKKTDFTQKGTECAEFLICPNVGEELKPLVKIASGGELSRIMLAIKTVFSDKESTGTLIYDEIDAGISGATSSTARAPSLHGR